LKQENEIEKALLVFGIVADAVFDERTVRHVPRRTGNFGRQFKSRRHQPGHHISDGVPIHSNRGPGFLYMVVFKKTYKERRLISIDFSSWNLILIQVNGFPALRQNCSKLPIATAN